jgi:ELWxxDGT repeat protein
MRLIFILFTISIASLGILSCNNGSQDRHPRQDQDRETGAIAVQVDWPDEPEPESASTTKGQAQAVKTAIDCNAMNVDKISAQVFSDTHDQLQTGGPWDCADGSGTISAVPARDNLIVRLCAFDINGDELYRGETPNVSVQSNQTAQVSLSMENVIRRNISIVQNIYPGSGSSFPHRFFELQNQLYFIALDINSGFELHVADTNSGSAQLLKDIYPNDDLDRMAVMAPTDYVELNGRLYFCANNGGGYHLWRTDGTDASTVLVPGAANYYNPAELTVLNDNLFFAADSAGAGRELWVFNESSGQVLPVADIYPGQDSSNPQELTAVGNDLFFMAEDGQNGYKPWKTDSEATACSLAMDIFSGSEGSYPRYLTNVNGRLFFVASDSGTEQIKLWMLWRESGSLNAESIADSQSSDFRNLTWIDGSMLAFSGYTSDNGQELYLYNWQTDTTPQRITDLNPSSASSYPANFVYLDGMLYFTAYNSNNIDHLWAYSLDQQTLTNLTLAMQYPGPRDLTALGQTLYFSASHQSFGRSLWAVDGNRTGLVVAADDGNIQHSPLNLIAASNGRLYYCAFHADYGEELFVLNNE